MAMTILGIVVLGLIIGAILLPEDNRSSKSDGESSYYDQMNERVIKKSLSRTPKY